MRSLWTKHGELITTIVCAVFVVAGALVSHARGATWLTHGLFLVGYIAGGYRQAIEGTTKLVRERELDVDLLMVVAAIGAAAIGYWFDGALLIFIFALSGTLEGYASARTQRDIESLMALNPQEAVVVRDGTEERISIEQLAIDDIVIIKPGERIPADGMVIEGASLVNQASITGESTPIHKATGDEVFAGTINGQGGLRVRVTKPAGETVIARIIALVQEAQERRPAAQLFIEKFELRYANVVVLGALLFVIVPTTFMGWAFADALYRAMVFLVVASPCALAASMMPALLSALSNGARNGVLFKGSTFVEALGKIRAVAFDKTGTLTTGHPTVTDLVTADNADSSALLARTASVESMSEHPIGAAIVAEARKRGLALGTPTEFQSRIGVGAEALVDGITWRVGKRELFAEVPPALVAEQRRLESEGNTVVLAGDGNRAQLAIALRDTVRPNARAAVDALRRLGVEHIVVITGDSETTAQACARAVGADRVHANLLPADKVRVVEELLGEYGAVAVVGDGVNDAPALATATVGIAMGGSGTDVALETADVVLMADDVSRIPYAIELGRRALRVVKQNLAIALGVIVLLVTADVLGRISLPTGVIGHEGSTLLVTLSGLRLLQRIRT
ncbi:MAG: cadmium-translocating P-type ATPase [Kofleriaceae bacterium]|nr:cadmium-translocating P-type ATPase [Kofleriaceae bacterium]